MSSSCESDSSLKRYKLLGYSAGALKTVEPRKVAGMRRHLITFRDSLWGILLRYFDVPERFATTGARGGRWKASRFLGCELAQKWRDYSKVRLHETNKTEGFAIDLVT